MEAYLLLAKTMEGSKSAIVRMARREFGRWEGGILASPSLSTFPPLLPLLYPPLEGSSWAFNPDPEIPVIQKNTKQYCDLKSRFTGTKAPVAFLTAYFDFSLQIPSSQLCPVYKWQNHQSHSPPKGLFTNDKRGGGQNNTVN